MEEAKEMKEESKYYKLLNGTWKFNLSKVLDEPIQGSEAPEFDDSAWDDIEVPSCWPVAKNEDGSFKYDKPMYTNTTYPWYYNTENLQPGQGMKREILLEHTVQNSSLMKIGKTEKYF